MLTRSRQTKTTIVLLGQHGCGKTTLKDTMIARASASLDPAAAQVTEREKSSELSVGWCCWKDTKIDLIDAPGDRSFAAEAELGAWAADIALVVVDTRQGVGEGTERAFDLASRNQLPVAVVVIGERLPESLASIAELAPASLAPMTTGAALVEAVAETDDALLEQYLRDGELCEALVNEGLVSAFRRRALVPLLLGDDAALLLDELARLASREEDRIREQRQGLAAKVFKVLETPMGQMTLLRVTSGVLRSDAVLINVSRERELRIGKLYAVAGSRRTLLSEASAGELVGLARLSRDAVGIGDTLRAQPGAAFVPPAIPSPVLTQGIAAARAGGGDKLSSALSVLVHRDVGLRVRRDGEQILVEGMGQLHLDVVVKRLSQLGVEATLSDPPIPYRETIAGEVQDVRGKFKRQTGGPGQFGVCVIDMSPATDSDDPLLFEDRISGGAIPRQYIPAVEKGIRDRMARGGVAGFPVVNVAVTLKDGNHHAKDSDSRSFERAGSIAFWEAFLRCRPVLLEPVLKLQVTLPTSRFLGEVIADLNARRGRVIALDSRGGAAQLITAEAPMAELCRYGVDLEALTGGRGRHQTSLSHYQRVPSAIAEQIVAERKVANDK